jgi:hypothetical protein
MRDFLALLSFVAPPHRLALLGTSPRGEKRARAARARFQHPFLIRDCSALVGEMPGRAEGGKPRMKRVKAYATSTNLSAVCKSTLTNWLTPCSAIVTP